MAASLKAVHPGRILATEFMAPIGLTAYRLAKELGAAVPTVNEVVRGRARISPEMGLLLAVFFGTSESFWINLQSDYDRRQAKGKLAGRLRRIKPWPQDPDGRLLPAR
jgi:antitoxin HigA-1